MYNIKISKEAELDLKKLPKKEAEIILKKIYSMRENPLHFIKRLTGYSFWRMRIGDYRAVLYLNTGKKILFVVKVGHRKDIYK